MILLKTSNKYTVVQGLPVNRYLRRDEATTANLSVLTATGTVDNSNVDFTFTSKPTLIVVNGAIYRENVGWTWTAGTLTATLSSPVGTDGDIYALG